MNKLIDWLKQPQVKGFFISVAVMAAVALAFFYPDNFEGNTLRQPDMLQGAANGQEAKAFYDATGGKALWTDALFGGMPTFQISPEYPSNALFTWLNQVYGLGLPAPSNLLFMMMMGFFILLISMRMRWYYALIGAMAWGLSSYFVIIIGAGHIWKFVTLTYIPPTIAGLVLCYRGRYVIGAAMTAIFAMLQLNANHPQMTYYFAFVMVALVIAWLIEAIREKKLRRWLVASAVTLAAGTLAVGANLPSLYNTYEYAKETKRSQSELTPLPDASGAASTDRPTGGMPRSQIVGWSYGWGESFSLLMPNIKGGASAKPEGGQTVYMGLDRLDGARAYDNSQAAGLLQYLPQYFNGTEGTNGPVYVGAIIFALFLVGCVVVKGPVKWALLAVTVFTWLLSLGSNFDALTDLMIYHFPLYNKFRAVESILVVAEFTMPLLAILGLHAIITRHADHKAVTWCFGICIGLCLIAWIMPSAYGDAITEADKSQASAIAAQISQMGAQQGWNPTDISELQYQYSLANPEVKEAVESLRYGLLRADALRSLIFLLLAFGLIELYRRDKLKMAYTVAGVGVLVLADLYNVDKRYVDHASFTAAAADEPFEFTPDPIDRAIMADKGHYRVMDIPGFNSPTRSYFHHMVGGYHAAKLNRYEDLIQRRLSPVLSAGYEPSLRIDSIRAQYAVEDQELINQLLSSYRTLDMLNAKYIITGNPAAPVLQNTSAMGPAWLVGKISYVDNADAEMKALETLDPAREAVADKQFAQTLGAVDASLAPGDSIALTAYTPNSVTYSVTASKPLIGVFSEVWFPWGWKATIDGQPAEIGRVNYILRAMAIPQGKHTVEMVFDPESIHTTSAVAYACISLIYMLVLGALFVEYRRKATPGGTEPLV